MEPNTWVSAKTSTAQVKAPQRGTALRAALMGVLVGAGASLQLVERGQHCLLVLGISEGTAGGPSRGCFLLHARFLWFLNSSLKRMILILIVSDC